MLLNFHFYFVIVSEYIQKFKLETLFFLNAGT